MTWRSLSRFLSGIRGAYNDINPSTLTGAIDVLVIEHEDGSFKCGPFYVRFGKLTAISPADKLVEFYLNGQLIEFVRMRLDPTGDAYFVDEDHSLSIDEGLTQSLDPNILFPPRSSRARMRMRKIRYDSSMSEPDTATDLFHDDSDVRFLNRMHYQASEENPSLAGHFTSDTAINEFARADRDLSWDPQLFHAKGQIHSIDTSRQETATEQEAKKHDKGSEKRDEIQGVYLEDLIRSEADKNLRETYIYSPSHTGIGWTEPDDRSDDEHSARSLSPICRSIIGLQMSLCGCPPPGETVVEEEFGRYLVLYEDFIRDPDAILSNPNLTILLNGKYYNWTVAAPAILSILSFNTPLPQRTMKCLVNLHMPKKKSSKSWFSWGARAEMANLHVPKEENDVPVPPVSPAPLITTTSVEDVSKRRKFRNRLTSEEVAKLGLSPGRNDVEFRLITKFQGTCTCSASIYLWRWNDRIVISDVDGTITRSDVLGHVLPMFGRDWTHVGVARLFNKISCNGYKFIYLSARALGQAEITRSYLRQVTQEDSISLPEGPVLLSPHSLIHAFRQEVIIKKPQEFKIACLKGVRDLFIPFQNPLFAGFGNKETDVISYKMLGIPECRIFTINASAEVKNESQYIKSLSYPELSSRVDYYFPPIEQSCCVQVPVFSIEMNEDAVTVPLVDTCKSDDEVVNPLTESVSDEAAVIPEVSATHSVYVDMSRFSAFTYWHLGVDDLPEQTQKGQTHA